MLRKPQIAMAFPENIGCPLLYLFVSGSVIKYFGYRLKKNSGFCQTLQKWKS